MSKQIITEEMHLEKEWFKDARQVKTPEELQIFMKHMLDDYQHDYGTVCHAVAACAFAAACVADETEGLTGFQASFVMWDFIRCWMYSHNKCGMKLIDYDGMLYPQYRYKYEKTLHRDTWKNIQKEAKENLEKEDLSLVHKDVVEHWKKIVNGEVPFGYTVEDQ